MYNKYIFEAKSTWKYRLDKWKKENDYDPETQTIDVDGHRVKFNFTGGARKRNIINNATFNFDYRDDNKAIQWGSPNNKISADKATFNMKHSDSHKFALGHEKGHFIDYDSRHKEQQKFKEDEIKKKKFINDEIEHGKLPSQHNRDISEYRADDYGVKVSSPKAMKHEVKDYIKAIKKTSNSYEDKEREYDRELLNDIAKKIIKYRNLADNATSENDRNKYTIKARQLYSHAKNLLSSNDSKKTFKREKDGLNMRLKSATEGKIKKRDIKK